MAQAARARDPRRPARKADAATPLSACRQVTIQDAAWEVMEDGLPQGVGQRHAAGPAAADHVRRARPYPGAHRAQARRPLFHADACCPTTSNRKGRRLGHRVGRPRQPERAAHQSPRPARHPGGARLSGRAGEPLPAAQRDGGWRPPAPRIATAPSCSSRRRASCRCSRR